MASRKPPTRNNHLQEAMALLISNQAAFVEQVARNDRERLALQRNAEEWRHNSEEWQRKSDERQRKNDEQQRKNEVRFDRIEARLASIEENLVQLPKIILQTVFDQLPKIKKEIGFKSPT
jgi:glutamyl/glutaminyl-tRNA synthetase